MPQPTQQPPDQPTRTPQPNRILAEPATVQACTRDYADAADVRQTMAQQQARGKR
jgi:hypothetical protein